MACTYGCSIEHLKDLNQQLEHDFGNGLPAELWELYRYVDGQVSEHGAAFFNGGCRLLSCEEAVVMHRVECSMHGDGSSVRGDDDRAQLLCISSSRRGGRKYAVSLVDGSVWLVSGLATRRLGWSLVEVLQGMLR